MKQFISRSYLLLSLSIFAVSGSAYAADETVTTTTTTAAAAGASGGGHPRSYNRYYNPYGYNSNGLINGFNRLQPSQRGIFPSDSERLNDMLRLQELEAQIQQMTPGEAKDKADSMLERIKLRVYEDSIIKQACNEGAKRFIDSFGMGVFKKLEDGTGKGLELVLRNCWEFMQTYLNPSYYYRIHWCGRTGHPITINRLVTLNNYVLNTLQNLSQQAITAAKNSERGKIRRHDGTPGEDILEDPYWGKIKKNIVKELERVAKELEECMGYYDPTDWNDKKIYDGAEEVVDWIRDAQEIIEKTNHDIELAGSHNQRMLAICIANITINFVLIKNSLEQEVSDKFVNAKTKSSYTSSPGYGGGGAFGGGMR